MNRLIIVIGCALMLASVGPAAAQLGKVPISTSSEEALASYKQGLELSERARAQEALPLFEQAIAKDPAFAMAYLGLANVQTSPKGFFENLRKAVSLADRVSDGERLTVLAAQATADNNTEKAKEYLEKLVQAYPKDERVQVALGRYYYGQEHYSLAIDALKKSEELAPGYSPAYNLLGYAYSRAGRYTEAEKAFKKYTELIPDESNPHDSYAELLMKIGKFDQSMQEYHKAISLNPKFYSSYLGLGMDYVLEGKYYDAIKVYRRLFDFAPDDGTRQQALFASVICYVHQKQFARAVAEQERNYELSRKLDDVAAMVADLGTLGDLLIEVGPIDQARARFEKARQIAGRPDVPAGVKEFANGVRLSGIVRVALHSKDSAAARAALAEFRAAAKESQNPAFMQAYRQHAGMVAFGDGRYDDALKELRQADQRSPRTLLLMGQVWTAKGDKRKAREFLTQAANFNEINIEFAFVHSRAKELLAKL